MYRNLTSAEMLRSHENRDADLAKDAKDPIPWLPPGSIFFNRRHEFTFLSLLKTGSIHGTHNGPSFDQESGGF